MTEMIQMDLSVACLIDLSTDLRVTESGVAVSMFWPNAIPGLRSWYRYFALSVKISYSS